MAAKALTATISLLFKYSKAFNTATMTEYADGVLLYYFLSIFTSEIASAADAIINDLRRLPKARVKKSSRCPSILSSSF